MMIALYVVATIAAVIILVGTAIGWVSYDTKNSAGDRCIVCLYQLAVLAAVVVSMLAKLQINY